MGGPDPADGAEGEITAGGGDRRSPARPRAYAYTRSIPHNRASFYDGNTLTVYKHEENFYGVVNAPENLDKAIDFVEDKFGIVMPLADLMVSDMYGK